MREFENEVEDEDILDNCCPSVHYLPHTEFGVTGGCTTCLPFIDPQPSKTVKIEVGKKMPT
jgi:hypothetical protein